MKLISFFHIGLNAFLNEFIGYKLDQFTLKQIYDIFVSYLVQFNYNNKEGENLTDILNSNWETLSQIFSSVGFNKCIIPD